MTNSFQSTAATNIYDAPVSTFVEPVRVLPKTSLVGLAETLQVVNPVLQTYLQGQIEKEKQAGILQGELDVLMADPKRLKEFTNALNSTNKKEAKEILGNNIFVRAGIEKRIAINHGLAVEGKLNQFLNNKTITVEGTDGIVRQVPLKEFSVNSEEFKGAIAEFSETQRTDVTGVRPSFINQYFMPEVAKAVQKAYINQEQSNREFVVNQTNTSLKDNILANFSTIDFSNFDSIDISNPESQFNIAFDNIQKEINYLDAIGALNSVSPTAMKQNVMEIAEIIFNTELRRNKSGVVAVQNFRNLIENLKVGPEQTLADGTKIQPTLGSFLGEDWNKMKARFVTNENAYDTFKKKKIAEVIKPRIINLLNDFEFQIDGADGTKEYNTEALEALQALFPDTPEIFLEVIEDLDVSRDEFYDNFAVDVLNQNFVSPLEALNQLRNFEVSLGTTITEEDTTELNKLKTMITTHLGKDSLALFRPRINALIKQSLDILGGNNLRDTWKKSSLGADIELKYYDATNKFNKAIIEISKLNLDPATFAAEIEQAMVNYAADITRINDSKTTKSYVLDESGIWSKAQEQLGIQLEEEKENESKPITVSENTFKTMQKNNEVEERDGKFYIKGSDTLINIEGNISPNQKQEKNNNFRENLKNFFTKPYESSGFSEGGFTTFKIESGDTLSAISEDFGIPMEAIMKANGITNANQIDIGDVLLIPEGVDYTDTKNINFIENLDKTKIITEQDHPYAPVRRKHNFQVIYDLAIKAGIKFPELVAAQAMHESTYGDNRSSENNFLGLKATPSEIARGESELKDTTEDRGKGLQLEKADFKKFENLEEMIRQYKIQWNDNFEGRTGTVNADTVLEALKLIKAGDYATDKDYVTKVMNLLNDAKAQGWY